MKHLLVIIALIITVSCGNADNKKPINSEGNSSVEATTGSDESNIKGYEDPIETQESYDDKIVMKRLDKSTDFWNIVAYDMGFGFDSMKVLNGGDNALDYYIQGLIDYRNGKKHSYSDAVLAKVRKDFNDSVQAIKVRKTEHERFVFDSTSQALKDYAPKYIEEQKKTGKWKTTSSGLLYQVLREGTGEKPSMDNVCVVDVLSTLWNGTKILDTYEMGRPEYIPITQVFSGWSEAMFMMKPGSKWKFLIPPDLAFGKIGMSPTIPGNAPVYYTIEMHELLDAGDPKVQALLRQIERQGVPQGPNGQGSGGMPPGLPGR